MAWHGESKRHSAVQKKASRFKVKRIEKERDDLRINYPNAFKESRFDYSMKEGRKQVKSEGWCCEKCGALIKGMCYNDNGYVTHIDACSTYDVPSKPKMKTKCLACKTRYAKERFLFDYCPNCKSTNLKVIK